MYDLLIPFSVCKIIEENNRDIDFMYTVKILKLSKYSESFQNQKFR